MKQEDKDILIKDLCTRLPYGIKVLYDNQIFEIQYIEAMYEELKLLDNEKYTLPIEDVIPYLLPLSSMTEEQKEELLEITDAIKIDDIGLYYEEGDTLETYLSQMPYTFMCKVVTWCYKNHFDVNGLIPLDLAKNATGLNIY